MKRTSTMVYRSTPEAQELYIFAENEQRIYNSLQYVEATLQKKIKKGVYDANKAIDAFYYVMCEASKMYRRLYGYGFSVGDRFTAAADFARNFTEEATA